MRTIKRNVQRVIISYTFFQSFAIKIIPYLKLIFNDKLYVCARYLNVRFRNNQLFFDSFLAFKLFISLVPFRCFLNLLSMHRDPSITEGG